MKGLRIGGFILLTILWIWLAQAVLRAGGINLKNLMLVAASGIIALVPLYRKYISPYCQDKNK